MQALEVEDRHGLAVYRIGRGEPVLLMPGPHRFERPGLDGFDSLVDGLVSAGRQVVTFDPPGSGLSRRPADLGLAEMLACTDETLDASGITAPVDALGHSMAGLVLLAYALERPSRIRRQVLVGTGSGGPAYLRAPGALWNRTHPGFPGLAALGLLSTIWPRRATETLLLNYIQRRSFVDPRHATVGRVEPGDWLRRRRGRPEWHRIARRLDLTPRLVHVTVPTLVLCGRHDPQFPPACSRQLAARIPQADLVLFDHSGHSPFLDEPGPFWRSVQDFLAAP